MLQFEIHPTTASDLPRLMAMDHSVRSESVWQLELRRDAGQFFATFREVRLPRPITLTYPHDPFALADDWKRRSPMLTAISGAEPVGYLSGIDQPAGSLVRITDIVVATQARRQGLGSALLEAAEAWATKRGSRRVMIELPSKNLPAIRMAQKHGYEFCGYNDHYYLSQDVALFFVRALR